MQTHTHSTHEIPAQIVNFSEEIVVSVIDITKFITAFCFGTRDQFSIVWLSFSWLNHNLRFVLAKHCRSIPTI